MTVDEVLSAPAEYDHSLEIRAVGPALVIVLELQAPPRLHVVNSTRSEFDSLRHEVEANPVWHEIISSYFAGEECLTRSDGHLARLDHGRPLETVRVSE